MTTDAKISNWDQFVEDTRQDIGLVRTSEEFDAENAMFRQESHNSQITLDAIKHMVDGMGDMNPLYRDREYAARTKYGRLICPPTFLQTVCYHVPTSRPRPPGIEGFYGGSEWEWFRPAYEGDEFRYRAICPSDLYVRPARTVGALAIVTQTGELFRHDGELVAKYKHWTMMPERGGVADLASMPDFSREDLDAIYAMQDREEIRGATPRYWEDVNVGDELPPVVRGPYTMHDKFAWYAGHGGAAPLSPRLWRLVAGREALYDPVNQLAIDLKAYEFTGDPFRKGARMHVTGPQTDAWVGIVVTNWMGDDGFLWKARKELRSLTRLGEACYCKGTVTAKYQVDEHCCVDLRIWAENQKGQVTLPGTATVILPSREHGPVVYPEPK